MLDGAAYTNSLVTQEDRESEVGYCESESADIYNSKLFGPEIKPITPRVTGAVVVLAEVRPGRSSGPVYLLPPPSTPPQEEEEEEENYMKSTAASDTSFQSGSQGPETPNIPSTDPAGNSDSFSFSSLDDIGSIIVGTVLKHAVADTTDLNVDEVVQNSDVIRDLYPNKSVTAFSKDDLEKLEYDTGIQPDVTAAKNLDRETGKINTKPDDSGSNQIKPDETSTKNMKPENDDEDSLLDSDEEYDEERDQMFRKKKKKYKLSNKRGLDAFKSFLGETEGKKNWFLWVDVDRVRLLTNQEDISG